MTKILTPLVILAGSSIGLFPDDSFDSPVSPSSSVVRTTTIRLFGATSVRFTSVCDVGIDGDGSGGDEDGGGAVLDDILELD
jgi:hypothetical protein